MSRERFLNLYLDIWFSKDTEYTETLLKSVASAVVKHLWNQAIFI